jgi:hypothetical protein
MTVEAHGAAAPVEASCCFCGTRVLLQDALQLIVTPQASVDAGEDESQSWFAHRPCFERAIQPEHRVFRWSR